MVGEVTRCRDVAGFEQGGVRCARVLLLLHGRPVRGSAGPDVARDSSDRGAFGTTMGDDGLRSRLAQRLDGDLLVGRPDLGEEHPAPRPRHEVQALLERLARVPTRTRCPGRVVDDREPRPSVDLARTRRRPRPAGAIVTLASGR